MLDNRFMESDTFLPFRECVCVLNTGTVRVLCDKSWKRNTRRHECVYLPYCWRKMLVCPHPCIFSLRLQFGVFFCCFLFNRRCDSPFACVFNVPMLVIVIHRCQSVYLPGDGLLRDFMIMLTIRVAMDGKQCDTQREKEREKNNNNTKSHYEPNKMFSIVKWDWVLCFVSTWPEHSLSLWLSAALISPNKRQRSTNNITIYRFVYCLNGIPYIYFRKICA